MKQRPPLYWRTLLIGGPTVVLASTIMVVDGRVILAVGLAVVAFAFFFVPWLLSPYSNAARRLAAPTDADLDRSERFASRLDSVPIFGVVWRFAERLGGNRGRREMEEYRRWRRGRDR